MRKIKFITFGCKVNQYETQCMREQFLGLGFKETETFQADIIIINTCTVTENSDTKSLRAIRRTVRESSHDTEIIVTGCLTEFDKDKIYNIEGVDLVLENKYKSIISSFISSESSAKVLKPHPSHLMEFINRSYLNNRIDKNKKAVNIRSFHGHTRAFVKVQDGCNYKCAFCKITLVRGKSRSKKTKHVIEEITGLVNRGYKEIVLTGICLGSYGLDLRERTDIVGLLEELSKVNGEFRIRLSSIEPNYISESLIDLLNESSKLCEHLHIPLQSGDNYILGLMRRPYSIEEVIDKVYYARNKNPYFSFSAEIIIGFAGETEKTIRNTMSALRKIQPLKTHIFKFSPRKGTEAFSFKNRVSEEFNKKWHKSILGLSDELSYMFREKFIGRKLSVLFERNKNCVSSGFSQNYIYVETDRKLKRTNVFADLEIKEVTPEKTIGSIISL